MKYLILSVLFVGANASAEYWSTWTGYQCIRSDHDANGQIIAGTSTISTASTGTACQEENNTATLQSFNSGLANSVKKKFNKK